VVVSVLQVLSFVEGTLPGHCWRKKGGGITNWLDFCAAAVVLGEVAPKAIVHIGGAQDQQGVGVKGF